MVGRGASRLFIAFTCSLVLGCGTAPAERNPVRQATGSITVGGKPAAGAQVSLYPTAPELQQSGLKPYGIADEFGTFSLTTYESGDGAPPGRYEVGVVWPDAAYKPKTPAEAEEIQMGGRAPDKLKGKYSDAKHSGLTITVTEGTGDEALPTLSLP